MSRNRKSRKRRCPRCGVLRKLTVSGKRFKVHEAYPLGPECDGSGQPAPPATVPAIPPATAAVALPEVTS